MRNTKHLLLILITAFVAAACGSSEPRTSSDGEPDWMGKSGDEKAIYASGSALATSREGAVTAATTVALQKISSQMGTEVQSIVEQFTEEYNKREGGQIKLDGSTITERATRTITRQNIQGYEVDKREVNRYNAAEYEAFIRLMLTDAAKAKMQADALKDAMSEDEKLYIDFKKSQAFKRLDEQMKQQKETGNN